MSIYLPMKKKKIVTEIKYINFANWVSYKIKSVHGFLNIDNDKKHICCWQDDTIHAYKSLYLHYLHHRPSIEKPSKLKSTDENKDS